MFVESDREKYMIAKEAIEAIIADHRNVSDPMIHIGDANPFG